MPMDFLGLQRADVERQSGHEHERDEIGGVGLRRRRYPARETSDGGTRAGFGFHGVVLLEMVRDGKGRVSDE